MESIQYPGTVDGMFEHLVTKLGSVVPPFELRSKAEIAIEVNRLKAERKAVILGHNYMEPALFHSVSDHTGDSLGLCRIAARTEAEIIVFCGVRFMAETAKILNPQRLVLLPSTRGGCSLAAGISAEDVRELKALYPGVPVVTYVNSYADVKAESDYACTSGNAGAMLRHLLDLGHRRVIFLPDRFLAANTAASLGLPVVFPERRKGVLLAAPAPEAPRYVIGWHAACEVHERFTVEDIQAARAQFPDVVVLAHPECPEAVVQAADFAGSTQAMIRHVEGLEGGRCLLLTECAMADNIMSSNPRVEMLRICSIRCPHMNEITLEETLESLRQLRHAVEVPEETRRAALRSIERMIAIG